jgi:ATP-dependent Clp protease adaptor protein ClpS
MTTEIQTAEKIEIQLTPPKLWKVIFLNDDSTPMEHVIILLTNIFGHDLKSAQDVTLEIHNTGSGVAGIYSFEIAEHKALEATNLSRAKKYPLKIQIEEE